MGERRSRTMRANEADWASRRRLPAVCHSPTTVVTFLLSCPLPQRHLVVPFVSDLMPDEPRGQCGESRKADERGGFAPVGRGETMPPSVRTSCEHTGGLRRRSVRRCTRLVRTLSLTSSHSPQRPARARQGCSTSLRHSRQRHSWARCAAPSSKHRRIASSSSASRPPSTCSRPC